MSHWDRYIHKRGFSLMFHVSKIELSCVASVGTNTDLEIDDALERRKETMQNGISVNHFDDYLQC